MRRRVHVRCLLLVLIPALAGSGTIPRAEGSGLCLSMAETQGTESPAGEPLTIIVSIDGMMKSRSGAT